ncbi:MAG: GDP-mannose 4,6-dehydratase [bacterium]
MRVLVTGGAGFIGSYLVEKLLENGDTVCAVDDVSTGNLKNIKHLLDNSNFELVIGSVLDKQLMENLIDKSDVIYHLAAAVGVKYVMENSLKSIKINIHGTETVLNLASKNKQKVFIASTSEIYGKNGCVPYNEDSDRLMGSTKAFRWSYACTKTLDEFMALAYYYEMKLPIVIARFFNTCGPRQTGQYGMVIPRFVRNALLNEPLTVYGDGTQSRCFTYVGDAVDAIIGLMNCDEAIGDVFNVGNTQEIQIRELAQKIIDMTGSNSEIVYTPYENVFGRNFEDMKRRVPDITKIRNTIGWEPKVNLDQLLHKVIDYERSQLNLSCINK